jgi:hypothetical protein
MPAGIMAAAFSDAFQDLHAKKAEKPADEKPVTNYQDE